MSAYELAQILEREQRSLVQSRLPELGEHRLRHPVCLVLLSRRNEGIDHVQRCEARFLDHVKLEKARTNALRKLQRICISAAKQRKPRESHFCSGDLTGHLQRREKISRT